MADGRELGWDEVIENDGPEFTTLPSGDYDFRVTSFERGRYNGGDKLPACNMATVNIQIEGSAGISTIRHRLYLHSSTEGLLCAFFTGIGLRKHGERLRMDWNRVTGARGRAKVGVRKWTGNDGREYEGNEIIKFYDPEDAKAKAPAAAAQAFQPGKF